MVELRQQARQEGVTLPDTPSLAANVSRWVNNHRQPNEFYRVLVGAHVDLVRVTGDSSQVHARTVARLVEAAAVAGDVDCRVQAERLTAMLEQLAPEEIASFDRAFWQRLAEAYRWDLWGLAYQLNGGCSDDGFVYFRCWLLAQGRATWEAALADPDSLMDHPVAYWSGSALEGEPMLYAAMHAYHARAEAELPDDGQLLQPAEPLGEYWDFEDDEVVRRRLPRTWARMT